MIVRMLRGPFGFEGMHAGTQAHELRWGFIGIRGDRTTAHWMLVFKMREAKFHVVTSQIGNGPMSKAANAVQRTLPKGYPIETVNPHAFLDDGPIEEGRLVDILKKRLSPEELARCTAALITRR